MDEVMAESQPIYDHDKESEQLENRIVLSEPAHKHDLKGHSIAEFLYRFEESRKPLQGKEVQKTLMRMIHLRLWASALLLAVMMREPSKS
ncbi:hypothetical protein CASFOL_009017 [Castilleja foliolosa]|uniref:Uncharacterized protein n=1 Tax=Castilleja foliolosa TaxID=1961234 RepID=A0ABD3E4Q1_9LAMI